jgi:hypothetical protein
MTTITTILEELNARKRCGRAQLYIYLKTLRIEPLGAKQRPQVYPEDTAQRILTHLGLADAPALVSQPKVRGRLLTVPQLKSARKAAKKGVRK